MGQSVTSAWSKGISRQLSVLTLAADRALTMGRHSINRKTVILWRQRFAEQRLDALWETAPGRGRKPTYDIDYCSATESEPSECQPLVHRVETRRCPRPPRR